MKTGDWLKLATTKLNKAGIGTARLDALVLAEDITGKERAYLLAHPEMELKATVIKKLDHQIDQRQDHQPLAYIRGKTEFYSREFLVDKRVLEPRPESETMIDLLKKIDPADQNLADIGTGSGALAITAKLEIPQAAVFAVDIDPNCLAVAKKNAKYHQVDINFYQGNLIEPLPSSSYILLANLPYVPDSFKINSAAMREPKLAIYGGPDGLDIYRQLFKQISSSNSKIEYILTESMPPQHSGLAKIADNFGYKLYKTDDFIQLFVK